MTQNQMHCGSYSLLWIYPDKLVDSLFIAPRLEMIKELRKLGWDVVFLSVGSSGLHEIRGVEILCFSRPDVYFLRQVFFHFLVISYILRNWRKFDFVFFHQTSLPAMLILRIFRIICMHKRPLFVMDNRTVPMEGRCKTIKDSLRGMYSNAMNTIANKFIDGQTTITQRMAEYLRIPKKQLWGTWPSGVNLDQFLPSMKNKSWPKNNQPIKLVYIGTFAAERDIGLLCQAVMEINHEGFSFELFLVGDGRDRENLSALAQQSEGKIRVFSPVPHDQVPAILSTMHVGVLPFPDESKFRVSSPIKLFEYLGSGLPVLATRIICHTDVIGEQPCAFWAEESSIKGYMDQLIAIKRKRKDLPRMGQAAIELSKNYTWAISAEKLSKALDLGLQNYFKKKIH